MKLFIASCLLALLALGDSLMCHNDAAKSESCDKDTCFGPKLMLKG